MSEKSRLESGSVGEAEPKKVVDQGVMSGLVSIRTYVMAALVVAVGAIVSQDQSPRVNKSAKVGVVSMSRAEQLLKMDGKIEDVESGYLGFEDLLKSKSELMDNPVKSMQERANGDYARFHGLLRCVELRSDLDTKNVMDFIMLMHELVHVESDDEKRTEADTKDGYLSKEMIPLTKDVVLSYEVVTKASEVEVGNALSDGMFKEAFKDLKGEPIDNRDAIFDCSRKFMSKFKLPEEYRDRAEALSLLAFVYYTNLDPKDVGNVSPAFIAFVRGKVLADFR